MHIADSLCYTAATNTTMQNNYTPIKMLKKKEDLKWHTKKIIQHKRKPTKGGTEKQMRDVQKINGKIENGNLTTSIFAMNVNNLNTPVKRQGFSVSIKK